MTPTSASSLASTRTPSPSTSTSGPPARDKVRIASRKRIEEQGRKLQGSELEQEERVGGGSVSV